MLNISLTLEWNSGAAEFLYLKITSVKLCSALAGHGLHSGKTTMTSFKAGIICAVVIAGAGFALWRGHQAQLAGHEENQALRQQMNELIAENARLSNQVFVAAGPPTAADPQERELMRLRGEVGGLKRELAEATRALAQAKAVPPPQTAAAPVPEQPDPFKQMGISKMNFAKGWMLAFMQYAQQHGGQLPPDFESAAQFAPDLVNADKSVTPAQFEITYKGALTEITNPQSIIVIREREAWQNPNGT